MIFNDLKFKIIRANYIKILRTFVLYLKRDIDFEIYIPKIFIRYALTISLVVNYIIPIR